MTADNYYSTNTNQFIIETEHPGWQEYLCVFDNALERSEYPDRIQYSIDPNFQLDITNWIDKKLKQHLNYGINIKPHEAWAIEYKDGGYQAVHNHTQQPNLISIIMYLQIRVKTKK